LDLKDVVYGQGYRYSTPLLCYLANNTTVVFNIYNPDRKQQLSDPNDTTVVFNIYNPNLKR
jgi:hypothetical protein